MSKPLRKKKPFVNIQKDDNCCLSWFTLAHLYAVVIHRERVSRFEKYFTDFNQGDIQYHMKVKELPTFDYLIILNTNVFELSSNDNTLSLIYIKENSSKKLRSTSLLKS